MDSIKLLLTLSCALCILISEAQTIISSASGKASGKDGEVNFTLGEFIYEPFSSPNGSIDYAVLISKDNNLLIQDNHPNFSIYPNPTSEIAFLNLDNHSNLTPLYYSIYNSSGSLLLNNEITKSITEVNVSTFSKGVYTIIILNTTETIDTQRIIIR